MDKSRGLCLYSTATQFSEETALASMYDASESEDSGRPDKAPVLSQVLPKKERL